jgi:diguanylate cyclase (GGDEF)-like protein
MSSAGPEQDLALALSQLWTRRRDGFVERVECIEAAVADLVGGALEEPRRAEAEREAHKLAGALGTFGVPGGTDLARELEHALAADRVARASPVRLSELVLALAREVERGPAPVAAPAAGDTQEHPRDDATDEIARARPVLVVSADAEIADRLAAEGAAQGIAVTPIGAPDRAGAVPGWDRAAAVVLDFGTDASDPAGLGLLERLAREPPAPPAFVLVHEPTFERRVALTRLGAVAVLPRTAAPAAIVASVTRSLARETAARSRVLAVDDDPSILAALEALLAPEGVEVVGLHEPEQLWDRLAEVAPDLVVLDVDIPSVSGIDLCRVLRADADFHELPVLFLSARTDPASVQRMFDAGADDYVAKPIVASELLGRIRNRIGRARLLRELADRDALTGVPNRRKASADLARLLLLARRYDQPLSVAVLDIDDFKRVNDRHGHVAGDAVLRALGALLARAFRGEGRRGSLGRRGVPHRPLRRGPRAGHRRLEDLLERFRALEVPSADGVPLRSAFSAGVAQYPLDAGDLQGLYRRADAALYRAKAQGRARVVAVGDEPGATREVDVLVVEDDDALRDVLVHALGTRGYSSAALADGRDAADALEGPDPALRPRVALLDVDLRASTGSPSCAVSPGPARSGARA